MTKVEILNNIQELRNKMLNLDDKKYNKINLKIMVKMQEKGYSTGGLTKNPSKKTCVRLFRSFKRSAGIVLLLFLK